MILPVCLLQIYKFEKIIETKIDELPFFLCESTFYLVSISHLNVKIKICKNGILIRNVSNYIYSQLPYLCIRKRLRLQIEV